LLKKLVGRGLCATKLYLHELGDIERHLAVQALWHFLNHVQDLAITNLTDFAPLINEAQTLSASRPWRIYETLLLVKIRSLHLIFESLSDLQQLEYLSKWTTFGGGTQAGLLSSLTDVDISIIFNGEDWFNKTSDEITFFRHLCSLPPTTRKLGLSSTNVKNTGGYLKELIVATDPNRMVSQHRLGLARTRGRPPEATHSARRHLETLNLPSLLSDDVIESLTQAIVHPNTQLMRLKFGTIGTEPKVFKTLCLVLGSNHTLLDLNLTIDCSVVQLTLLCEAFCTNTTLTSLYLDFGGNVKYPSWSDRSSSRANELDKLLVDVLGQHPQLTSLKLRRLPCAIVMPSFCELMVSKARQLLTYLSCFFAS
jgi:hypothetical protein